MVRIVEGKAAVGSLRADKNLVDQALNYIVALEQQLRNAAMALERAKDLVGKDVILSRGYAGHNVNNYVDAPKWFDEKIAAARELVDAKPTPPVL